MTQDQSENQGRSCEACERFSEGLAAYLDGGEAPELLAHAASCDFCQCVLADVQLIRGAGPALAIEDPPPRVWVNVRLALEQEGIIHHRAGLLGGTWAGLGRMRWPAPVIAVAAAVVMIVLFKFPGVLVRPAIQPESAAVAAQTYAEPADLASLRQSIQPLEQAYQANASMLEPSLKTAYQTSLRSLNEEIQECQASMKREPQDDLARQYLSTAYFQKAQLLRSALDYNLR